MLLVPVVKLKSGIIIMDLCLGENKRGLFFFSIIIIIVIILPVWFTPNEKIPCLKNCEMHV